MLSNMAIYERFEDLPVWQEAARLYNSALDLLQTQKIVSEACSVEEFGSRS